MVTLLSTSQKVLGLIPGSTMIFFFSGKVFHGNLDWFFISFVLVLFLAVFEASPCTLLTRDQGRLINFVCVPIGLEYLSPLQGALAYKSLVTMEMKLKKKRKKIR